MEMGGPQHEDKSAFEAFRSKLKTALVAAGVFLMSFENTEAQSFIKRENITPEQNKFLHEKVIEIDSLTGALIDLAKNNDFGMEVTRPSTDNSGLDTTYQYTSKDNQFSMFRYNSSVYKNSVLQEDDIYLNGNRYNIEVRKNLTDTSKSAAENDAVYIVEYDGPVPYINKSGYKFDCPHPDVGYAEAHSTSAEVKEIIYTYQDVVNKLDEVEQTLKEEIASLEK